MNAGSDLDISMRPFQDRNLKFPQKPCLIADLRFFHMPDGLGIQARGGESVVVLRGQFIETAIDWLILMLDGSRTLEQIFAQRPDGVKPQQLSKALIVMFNRGLFAEAPESKIATGSDAVSRKQLLFFGRKLGITRANALPEEVQRKLSSARIALVGDGLFGTAVFDILFRSGCTEIRAIDWASDGFMRDSIMQLIDEAGVSLPAPHMVSRSTEEVLVLLDEILPSTDLLVTATTCGSTKLFEGINRLCLSHSVKWLRGNDDGVNSEIGPYVNPYNSACYRCMALRRMSAAEHAIEEELYQIQLSESGDSLAHSGEFLAGTSLSASILSAEAVRIITMFTKPSLENSVLTVTVDGTFSKDSFVRVPRCPDCYRGTIETALEKPSHSARA